MSYIEQSKCPCTTAPSIERSLVQPTSKLEFHSTEEQKIKEETMEESLGLGKKSYGTETDTET